MTDREKFYITTSIPYLNGAPHLGHALEYVQADVVARYFRAQGHDVWFLTGADEHGAKIARFVEAAKKNPKEFVDAQVEIFKQLLSALNISHDDFIRTSDQLRHWPGAQALWKKLEAAGDIYKGTYKGLYCMGHEAFVTEKDLDGGVCRDHKKQPEAIEEENYLFRLSKYKDRIKQSVETGELSIIPEFRKTEMLNMLAEAEDVSFSRPSKDISWGIPVPDDATQTMYVWCDALSNYITALGYGGANVARFEKFWPADAHVIGKDISRFHAIIWPAMLLSANLPLPKKLIVHGFVHISGEKMSKSTGNVVDPLAICKKYGGEALRFYLFSEIPTFNDGDYTDKHFAETYAGLLVDGIGNLVSRVAKMVQTIGGVTKPLDDQIARYPMKTKIETPLTISSISFESTAPALFIDQYMEPAHHQYMSEYKIGEAIKNIWALFHALDSYIEDYKIYKAIKDKPDEAKIMLWNCAYSLVSAARFLEPFMSETADKIFQTFGASNTLKGSWTEFRVTEIPHLFPKIEK